MDLTKFKAMISGADKDGLLRVLKNVRDKNAHEHEDLVLQELNARFPGWEVTRRAKSGGRTFNTAVWKGQEQSFATAKDGFTWLVERMLREAALQGGVEDSRLKIASSSCCKYLARSPQELFSGSPHLAEDGNNFQKMPGGWYLNVNLSNEHKFGALARMSWVVRARYLADWDWKVDANTQDFVNRRSMQKELDEVHEFLEQLMMEASE
ncbi:MAG: hypothetical protein GKR94_13590 [Gammaproteobacteria bacterium]|nr:hypothetical protein [Gammaproteobacteria bacterium]